MNLGVALRLTGEFEGALDCFRKAIRLTPDNPEAYLNIGILEHEANGDTDAAIASLQKAIELDANSSLAHSSLAQVCLDADDIPRGILSYQKAMKLSPDDADLYNDAAWSLVTASGRDPRPDASSLAVEWARTAVELSPDDAAVLNTLGVALYRAKQWQEACNTLERSVELGSGGSYDWLFLAMANWQLDQKDKALAWYEKSMVWKSANQADLAGDAELQDFYAEAAKLMTARLEATPDD